jgi:PIN domain nuclease of toxin-antitoxin system
MNILVDTQVLLWAQADSPRLSSLAKRLILSDKTFKWVSHVSLFEIAIKYKIGKLPEIGLSPADFFDSIQQDGFRLLPISTDHIIAYDRVPFFEDHRDPFDRLILATALHEGWPVMSADGQFQRYVEFVPILW